MICPKEGSFTAWKKCVDSCGNHVLVELVIPADAERLSTQFTRTTPMDTAKCRASKAIVKHIYSIKSDGIELCDDQLVVSSYDPRFIYSVGQTVAPRQPFNPDRRFCCASGIHFFMSKEEALRYDL